MYKNNSFEMIIIFYYQNFYAMFFKDFKSFYIYSFKENFCEAYFKRNYMKNSFI